MRSERAFTLIEVLVALAVGSLVVAMAHRSFGAAADFSLALRRQSAAHDEVMETRRFLAAALGSADAATQGSVGFRGDPVRIAFGTWMGGTMRNAELTVEGGRVLVVVGRDTTRLMRSTAFAAEFLLEYGADAQWVHGWQSPASAPLAVRICIARGDSSGMVDTLLIAIGRRG